jgi:hypothetical protein
MKNVFFVYCIAILISSCKISQADDFSNIINTGFLSIVDTTAYSTGSFLSPPNSETKQQQFYNICYTSKVEDSKSFWETLKSELVKEDEHEFLNLLDNDNSKQNITNLQPSQIQNTGKYKLVLENSNCDKVDSTFVGSIKFYQPLFNDSLAIVFISIRGFAKAGLTKACLFKSVSNKWQYKKFMEIERW